MVSFRVQVMMYAFLALALVAQCAWAFPQSGTEPAADAAKKYTEAEAKEYLVKLNEQLLHYSNLAASAEWAYASNITDENLQNKVRMPGRLTRLCVSWSPDDVRMTKAGSWLSSPDEFPTLRRKYSRGPTSRDQNQTRPRTFREKKFKSLLSCRSTTPAPRKQAFRASGGTGSNPTGKRIVLVSFPALPLREGCVCGHVWFCSPPPPLRFSVIVCAGNFSCLLCDTSVAGKRSLTIRRHFLF